MSMSKEKYLEKRQELLNQAEKLLEQEKMEAFKEKEQEIENLDERYEKQAKAKANMDALKDNAAVQSDLVQGGSIDSAKKGNETDNPYNTREYRKEFMNFAKTGEMSDKLKQLKNEDQVTTTSDAGAVIPTTIIEEAIREMEEYGQIFDRVRKLNIQGGVEFPITDLKPTANWIGEEETSDRQKFDMSNKVEFSYHGLECRISVSMLANVTTLDVFESEMTDLIAEAMVKALDKAVIDGDGSGKPTGILNDDRVPADNKISLTEEEFSSWESWKKKVMSNIPLAYRAGGSWIMASGTFEGYIDGMVDANGQPVGRTNRGITDGPQERFDGREVIPVEDDVVTPYSSASAGDEVVVFCDLSDYAINSNMQMTMYRWTDHDKNEEVDKAILVADGKILDPHGVIIVEKA